MGHSHDEFGYADGADDYDNDRVREQLEEEREERQACYELLEKCRAALAHPDGAPRTEAAKLVRAIEVRVAPRVGSTKRKVAGA